MKGYKGSFTIEASCVFPLILLCICVAIWSAVSLHDEVLQQVADHEKNMPIDIINCMYRREFIKDILGEWYED